MDLELCAWCPRLCRHVCPVSVATAWEAATPTALATGAWLRAQGHDVPLADLCLSCGACTAHCGVHQPAADAFRALRTTPPAEPLSAIVGDGAVVDVLFPDDTPTGTWIRTADALGHDAWRAGDAAVLTALARHFGAHVARVRHGDVAAVLLAAGVKVERVAPPPAERTFRTCWAGPSPSVEQLACCGRRERFDVRAPEAAAAIARDNVRRMGDTLHTCDDAACAAWLRAHGARIEGPDHASTASPSVR